MNIPAEKDVHSGIQGVDSKRILGTEHLQCQSQPRADITPRCRGFDNKRLSILIFILNQRPRKVFCRPVDVIQFSIADFGKGTCIFGVLPFQTIHVRRDFDGSDGVAGLPWRSEHKSCLLDRVTHHVVENAAPLQLSFPEPGHMRPAVLLCRPGKIGPPCQRRSTCPDELLASLDSRLKDLILQVSIQQIGFLGEFKHSPGLTDIAAKRFFTGHAEKLPFPCFQSMDDLFHVFYP